MKRFIIASMAALMAASPLATTAASADPWDHHDRRGDWDRDRDHRGDWDRDRRDRDRRGDWDDRRHNGYTYNGRWYYGPPPGAYRGHVDYGYHQWRRGDRLPGYYWNRYREVDYRYYRLGPPPRGYHYVRDDRGAILLVGITTGIILSSIFDRY